MNAAPASPRTSQATSTVERAPTPVVVYPILVPMIMSGTKATAAILAANDADAWFWIKFLAAYDCVFTIVALWTFEALVIE